MVQRNHRIDTGGAAGREVSGEQRHREHDGGRGGDRNGVGRSQSEEQRRYAARLHEWRSASQPDPLDHLYKEIQFGLRAAVGTRTLDALLEDKTAIDREVAAHLGSRFTEIGVAVLGVGVKDIILPGDMKELLGKVVEAEKVAQANVIRRREETNATRSLLNTAKVMESNAVALRLKELETLEKVTEKVGTLSVYGGLDAVLNELVRLKQ